MSALCPCGSNGNYTSCCGQFIHGHATAETAEQLMRSRFSAYAKGEFDYIWRTYSQKQRNTLTRKELAEQAGITEWLSLVVKSCSQSGDQAEVEFCAYSRDNLQFYRLHERSYFVIEEGQWHYSHGDIMNDSGMVELGRNDICLCGSGKKYKKCCGK